MKKSVRIYIDGAVQGVFFRNFVKEEAEKRDLRGFVRNLEDGRVEIFLEGDNVQVDEMTEVCRKGPKHAQIRTLEIKPEKFQDFKQFKVLYV